MASGISLYAVHEIRRSQVEMKQVQEDISTWRAVRDTVISRISDSPKEAEQLKEKLKEIDRKRTIWR